MIGAAAAKADIDAGAIYSGLFLGPGFNEDSF